MTNVEFRPTQKATQKLQHGRITWEIDNANVVRFRNTYGDPKTIPTPAIEFAGEGLATYEIKMIYQPSPNSFPCLVSNPRFRLTVYWNNKAKEYFATPVDCGEMNRSGEWLSEGVRTMNALHAFSLGGDCPTESVPTKVDESGITSLSQPADGWLNKIAAAGGTFVGSLGKAYFS